VSRDGEAFAAAVERLFALLVRRRWQTSGPDAVQLTPTQRAALAAVVDDGPLRLGQLADRIGTTDPTATRAVDALEAEGLVERIADPDDRRAIGIAATTAGRSLLAERRRRLAEMLEEPYKGLAKDDRKQLAALLAELNDLLEG
jgi:DNA-binding MarR family transcriptional regulator